MIKMIISTLSLSALLSLQGCLTNSDMHSSDTRSSTPSLTVMSAKPEGGLYKVTVKRDNFDYHTGEENIEGKIPNHWHLERDVSKDGNSHEGFIACSYSDELLVDGTKMEGSANMIVSMRDSDHNMVGQGYHMMDKEMQSQCMSMQEMNGSSGHMMDMTTDMNGMEESGMSGSDGHMMDMSSSTNGMNTMPMMPMCAWQTGE